MAMVAWRSAAVAAALVAGMAASPASAQFFFQSHDFKGAPVVGEWREGPHRLAHVAPVFCTCRADCRVV